MRRGGIFDYDGKSERLAEVQRELEQPDIWNKPEHAQALGQERVQLEKIVGSLDRLTSGLADTGELLELAEQEDDEATVGEIVADLDAFESVPNHIVPRPAGPGGIFNSGRSRTPP